jgi:hypothetical protein
MKNRHVLPLIAAAFISCAIPAAVFGQTSARAFVFERTPEPNEHAFTLLVPRGWLLEGGAFRILDERYGGALNMTECKFDLAVKSDAAGSVMIRWLPEMLCIDTSQAWGNPEGAIFNNALVRTKRDPVRFLVEVGIPYAHPAARGVTVKDWKSLPALASLYQASVPKELSYFTTMGYYAAVVTVTYEEGGTRFMERLVTVIEDFGPGGGGLWKNRMSMLIRAPEKELAAREAVLAVIQGSGEWSIPWIDGEIRGQMQRQSTVALTQAELQRIDREIADGKRTTQESIQRDMYLTLTGQEDYRNPFTGKMERDTSEWKRRWVNESGGIIYTDDTSYDPNRDPDLKTGGYKLSQGR